MDKLLTRAENAIILVTLLGALAMGVAQVVMRYAFNYGFVWTETMFVLLTILGAMVGGSRAVSEGHHIRIGLLADRLPEGARRVIRLIALATTIGYVGLLCYAGYAYVAFVHMIGAVSVETGIPNSVIFAIVPLSMLLFLIRYLQQVPGALRGEAEPGTGHRELDGAL